MFHFSTTNKTADVLVSCLWKMCIIYHWQKQGWSWVFFWQLHNFVIKWLPHHFVIKCRQQIVKKLSVKCSSHTVYFDKYVSMGHVTESIPSYMQDKRREQRFLNCSFLGLFANCLVIVHDDDIGFVSLCWISHQSVLADWGLRTVLVAVPSVGI